jgi:hypothetical protein
MLPFYHLEGTTSRNAVFDWLLFQNASVFVAANLENEATLFALV